MLDILTDIWNFLTKYPMEILSFLATVFIGIAAILVSRNSNRLTEKTIELTEQSQTFEKEMKKHEVDIALFDKRIDVFVHLEKIIHQFEKLNLVDNKGKIEFSEDDSHRFKNSMEYLFPKNEFSLELIRFTSKVFSYLLHKEIPSDLMKKHVNYPNVLTAKTDADRIRYSFLAELNLIRDSLESCLDISKPIQ